MVYGKLYCLSDFCRGSYWILTYGGYAGDLSPRSALDILKGKENVALIDIRPEAREYTFFIISKFLSFHLLLSSTVTYPIRFFI